MAFVLVIDGNHTLAARASDVLIAAGHACGWVTGIAQAMTLMRWRAPDLMLLDHNCPAPTAAPCRKPCVAPRTRPTCRSSC